MKRKFENSFISNKFNPNNNRCKPNNERDDNLNPNCSKDENMIVDDKKESSLLLSPDSSIYNAHQIRHRNSRNIFHQQFNVSISHLHQPTWNRLKDWNKFNNFQVHAVSDSHDEIAVKQFHLSFLQKRSRIIEIVSAQDLIFVLNHSGMCSVFSANIAQTNKDSSKPERSVTFSMIPEFKRLCYVNIAPDEVVRSLFYNKLAQSLLCVSVHEHDRFATLKCRSTKLSAYKTGKSNETLKLFENESLNWPGFVEFDDTNKKIITFSAATKIYKVWSLASYELLYKINDENIEEMKLSSSLILCVYKRSSRHVPIKILNIEDGSERCSMKHLLHTNKEIDLIEQFNEKLLVKQQGENLQIVDVKSKAIVEVDQSVFPKPAAFIFLYKHNLFLTFLNGQVKVWNFKGEFVSDFIDHQLFFNECNPGNVYINPQQDIIISYCKEKDDIGNTSKIGSINVSNILTGELIAKIDQSSEKTVTPPLPKAKRITNDYKLAHHSVDIIKPCNIDQNRLGISDSEKSFISDDSNNHTMNCEILYDPSEPIHESIESFETACDYAEYEKELAIKEGLCDISALFYNEKRNEIYTGNKQGHLLIWSNSTPKQIK